MYNNYNDFLNTKRCCERKEACVPGIQGKIGPTGWTGVTGPRGVSGTATNTSATGPTGPQSAVTGPTGPYSGGAAPLLDLWQFPIIIQIWFFLGQVLMENYIIQEVKGLLMYGCLRQVH